jgi:hypothetical protein
MRIDGNSAYDRGEEDRRKWNYRYTMVTIIAILLIIAAAMVVWDDSRTWLAEEEQGGNIETNDEREDYIIGEGGLKVVQPVPTVDSRDKPAPIHQERKSFFLIFRLLSPKVFFNMLPSYDMQKKRRYYKKRNFL